MPVTASAAVRLGVGLLYTASSSSAVKAKQSPSSTASRLKLAARCSVMGSSATAVKMRLPQGAALTANAASSAKISRFASRPSASAGVKPRCRRYAKNTAPPLAK